MTISCTMIKIHLDTKVRKFKLTIMVNLDLWQNPLETNKRTNSSIIGTKNLKLEEIKDQEMSIKHKQVREIGQWQSASGDPASTKA